MTGGRKPRPAKRHHIVPESHLNRFLPDGGKLLWVYDKERREHREQPPRNTSVVRGVHDLPGDDPAELERMMAELEGAAQDGLRALVAVRGQRFELTDEQRARVAIYVALLYGRSKAVRGWLEAVMTYTASGLLDTQLQHPDAYRDAVRERGSDASDEEIERDRIASLGDLRSGRFQVKPHAASSLLTVTDSLTMAPLISEMHWRVLRQRRAPYFVLGDTAVTLDSPSGNAGFAMPDVEACMPVSPETSLLLTNVGEDGQIVDLVAAAKTLRHDARVRSWAELYGRRAWWYADREIYGRSRRDLTIASSSLSAEDRDRRPAAGVLGGPAEWTRYLPKRLGGNPPE